MGASSSKPTAKISARDKAILDLKVQRDKLKQYQKKIQLVLDKEVSVAKACLAKGDKRRALLALKKKKYQEQLLSKTDDQLINLEQLTQTIEYAVVEQSIIKGLETGNKVLKEIHNELSIEKVEQIMADTEDALEYQRELDALLTTQISVEETAEIEKELDQLIESQMQEALPQIPAQPLPKVAEVKEKQKTKVSTAREEELEEDAQMIPA